MLFLYSGNERSINECAAECAHASMHHPNTFLIASYSEVFRFTSVSRSLDYLTAGGIPAVRLQDERMTLENPQVVEYLESRTFCKKSNVVYSMRWENQKSIKLPNWLLSEASKSLLYEQKPIQKSLWMLPPLKRACRLRSPITIGILMLRINVSYIFTSTHVKIIDDNH